MLKEGLYTISNLQALIKESNEFNPKMGNNVVKDNAKNNDKAVEDIMNETDKLNSKAKFEKRDTNPEIAKDLNKTTLDLDFDYEPSDAYKKRVEDLVKGKKQDSTEEENKSVDYSGNEKFYDEQSIKSAEINKEKAKSKHSGLTANKFEEETFKDKTLFPDKKTNKKTNENTMKRLHFKNTRFLSESQMLSKVPEDYKIDGNVFLMKDSTGAEFIVECTVDDRFNFAQFKVNSKPNKETINEEFKRIEKLYEYKSSDYNTGTNIQSRKDEDLNVANMLDLMKNIKSQK